MSGQISCNPTALDDISTTLRSEGNKYGQAKDTFSDSSSLDCGFLLQPVENDYNEVVNNVKMYMRVVEEMMSHMADSVKDAKATFEQGENDITDTIQNTAIEILALGDARTSTNGIL